MFFATALKLVILDMPAERWPVYDRFSMFIAHPSRFEPTESSGESF